MCFLINNIFLPSVIIIPFSGFDVVGLILSASRQDCIRMTIRILEENLRLAVETGENQVIVIFDMDGFNIRQYAWRPGKSFTNLNTLDFLQNYFNFCLRAQETKQKKIANVFLIQDLADSSGDNK